MLKTREGVITERLFASEKGLEVEAKGVKTRRGCVAQVAVMLAARFVNDVSEEVVNRR